MAQAQVFACYFWTGMGALKNLCVGSLLLGSVILSSATPVTLTVGEQVQVREIEVDPTMITRIRVEEGFADSDGYLEANVYAGLNHIEVKESNGNIGLVDAFCIDPFHYSSDVFQNYSVITVTSLTKNPPNVSSEQATQIAKFWSYAYEASKTDALTAAALQVAIWETVGFAGTPEEDVLDILKYKYVGQSFVYYTPGSALALKVQDIFTQSASYTPANLLVLHAEDKGQDYIVEAPVPEAGTTIALLSLSLLGLAALKRQAVR